MPLLPPAAFGINDIMPSFSANPEMHQNHQPGEAPRLVVLVLFDRTKMMDVVGPLQVFNDARRPGGDRAYRVLLLSEAGGPVVTDTGVALDTLPFAGCRRSPPDMVPELVPDTLLVSGGDSALEAARSAGMQGFLAETAGSCRRFGSVCMGAFILAQGGHLDGRRATTHWENARQLQEMFPAVAVHEESIFEEDGGVWTSAGVTAGMDMALAMVEQDLGRAEALRLAQSLVLYVKRSGGQRQFSAALSRQVASAGGQFDPLVTEILRDLAADLSVPRLAEMARMSERSFCRRFAAVMGESPARFVEDLRVDAACEALQRGEARLAELPRLYGFGNPERMRRAFRRRKGIAPSEYQARFAGEATP